MRSIRQIATAAILLLFMTLIGLVSFIPSAIAQWEDQVDEKSSLFYWEPSLGIFSNSSKVSSTAKVNATTAVTTNTSASSFGGYAGANLGWQFDYVHVLLSSHLYQAFDSKGGTLLDFGAGFGWEWNIPMQTNVQLVKMTALKSPTSASDFSYSPFGFRLGVSYFVTKTFKVNASFTSFEQDFSYSTAAGIATSGKLTDRVIMVGATFPMPLDYPTRWWREHTSR